MAENEEFGETRNYKESNVKKVIEEKLLPVVEGAVGKDNIVSHSADLTSVDMQNEFGEVDCRMRPISFDEARRYNELLVNKKLSDWYWTLTPWSTETRGWKYSMAVVSPSGSVSASIYDNGFGVRPFCIFSSKLFESRNE